MSTTKTIDERLRAAAKAELHMEIDRLTKPLETLLYAAEWPAAVARVNGADVSVKAHELLGAVSRSLKAALEDKRGDEAVKAFMAKVDSLQDQLDELKDIAHDH
jgi:hypothetical protein